MPKVKDAAPEEVRAAYELHDEVRTNPGSRRLFEEQPPALDELQQRVVEQLNVQGYSIVPFAELFSEERWEELAADAAVYTREVEALLDGGTAPPPKQPKPGKEPKPAKPGKEKFFLGRRYKKSPLSLDSPWLETAASARMLDIVNSYLRMWSKLSYADQWYSPPRGGEADRLGSMRWHRDYNDQHLVKVFVYLWDVDEGAGPLEYVPGSARSGPYAQEWAWAAGSGETYPPQEEFAERIPQDAVTTFTAPGGSVIFCDTSGFHRGGFATKTPRGVWVFNYVSPAALETLVDRNFEVLPEQLDTLEDVERYAVT